MTFARKQVTDNDLESVRESAMAILERLAEFMTDPNRHGALKGAKIALHAAQENPDAALYAAAILDYAVSLIEQESRQNTALQ